MASVQPGDPDAGIVEGATRLFSPGVNTKATGPGRREKGAPFYNPGMALNRDLSVLLAESEGRRKGREIDFADALAGTGARSVRVAAEVQVPLIVHANDAHPAAAAAIRRTARAAGLPAGRLLVTEGDAYPFLAARRYDVVDVDPHGSPMPFLDAAVRATRPDGLVCVTATDTGALAGTFPRVARRRYGAHHGLHKAPWRAEVGLRILGAAVVQAAARFDRAAAPVLCVAHGHWMRVVARLDGGRGSADTALKRLRTAVVEEATGVPDATGARGPGAAGGAGAGRFLGLHEQPADGADWAGPLWSGPLHDGEFVAGLRAARAGKTLAAARGLDPLLTVLAAEAEAPPFWLVPDGLQKALGPPPRRDVLLARLQAAGFKAARSHMDPQGVRTDASLADLRRLWPGS